MNSYLSIGTNPCITFIPVNGYGSTRISYCVFGASAAGETLIIGNNQNGVGVCSFWYGNQYGALAT